MVLAVAACALIGGVQGSIVAFVGVPSFVVTLGGFLIWQGVILNTLEQRGTIIIQDRWINYTDSYAFSHFAGYLDRGGHHRLCTRSASCTRRVAARGTQIAKVNWTGFAVKTAGIAVAAFGTVAIANHGKVIATSLGLPLSGVIVIVFFILLTFLAKWTTFGRHVYAVGGNAEAARRAGINVPRIRVLVFMLSGATAGMGGIIFASQVNSVALTFPPGNLLLNAIASAVIGGVEPVRRPRRGARRAARRRADRDAPERAEHAQRVERLDLHHHRPRAPRRRDARHGRRSPPGPLRPLREGRRLLVAVAPGGQNAVLEDQPEPGEREEGACRRGSAHVDDPAEQDEQRTDHGACGWSLEPLEQGDGDCTGIPTPGTAFGSERQRASLRDTSLPTFVPRVRPAVTSPGSSMPRSTPCVAARAAWPANERPVNAVSTSSAA